MRDLVYAEGSPGLVFKLDEDSVLAYLDSVADLTGGALRFDDTPLARQVIRDAKIPLNPMAVLEQHYA